MEGGRLQSMGSQRVGHDPVTNTFTFKDCRGGRVSPHKPLTTVVQMGAVNITRALELELWMGGEPLKII